MEEMRKRPVTSLLVVANIIVFLLVEFTGGTDNTRHMLQWGACYGPYVWEEGQWYRIFTCLFLHFGMAHLANNMLVLAVLGMRLEGVLGHVKMLLVYFVGGMGGNLLSLALEKRSGDYTVSAGASGATFALMGAVLLVALRNHGRMQDLGLRQILIMAALSLYLGFVSEGVDNAAHVGGLLGGFLVAALLYWGNTRKTGEKESSPYGNGIDQDLWR